ncbi:MAG: LytTR family transcriptional regulator [Lentimicrobiaceae bacterium]|nr:LytTR family transcriptional regulator [Lentimicrobiaceae bacterium]
MKKIISHIIAYFYFLNFKNSSFSKKKKKAIKGEKYITRKKKKEVSTKNDLIVFNDEKGMICFSIKIDSLYYIESDTNYITIFYANQGKIDKFLVRSSLKMVLEKNKDENLVRCHHSYIVNFKKVNLYKKDKEGGVIELSDYALPSIPVSKSYIENILQKFQIQLNNN